MSIDVMGFYSINKIQINRLFKNPRVYEVKSFDEVLNAYDPKRGFDSKEFPTLKEALEYAEYKLNQLDM